MVVVVVVDREGRVEDLPLVVVVVVVEILDIFGVVVVVVLVVVVVVGLVEALLSLDLSKEEKVIVALSLLGSEDNLVVKLIADFGRETGVVEVVGFEDMVVVFGVVAVDFLGVAAPFLGVLLGVVVYLLPGFSSSSFAACFLKTLINTACLSLSLSPSSPQVSSSPPLLPLLFEYPEVNKCISSSP